MIRLGEVSIASVVEINRSFYPTPAMLPDSTPEAVARHYHWLKPDFFDETVGDLPQRDLRLRRRGVGLLAAREGRVHRGQRNAGGGGGPWAGGRGRP